MIMRVSLYESLLLIEQNVTVTSEYCADVRSEMRNCLDCKQTKLVGMTLGYENF
jgi:hypothetical protein